MNKQSIRLSKHIKPLHYEITMKPDLETFLFEGTETIDLSITAPTREITLHAAELEIDSAELKVGKKELWAAKISYNQKAETATLSFLKPVPKGDARLILSFRGTLKDNARGFYKSRYVVNGQDRYLATTQFEATDARKAFPCFDEPEQKAKFTVHLVVPNHMTAISNTVATITKKHSEGYKIISFRRSPLMSSYLLAFIVGEFESVEGKTKNGVLVRVFTTPGKKQQAGFALHVGIKGLEFFEDYFGIKYPMPTMDMIGIPDFAAGAMENWGAVTYREPQLLVDETQSSGITKQHVASTIIHELSHQWFGNLVTMRWWTDLWLNEGFAAYMTAFGTDALFPKWDMWKQFMNGDFGEAIELDALKNTHPIEVEVRHPDEINEIFDAISYDKGASVIRMLAHYIGPVAFRKGLHNYLKKFAYKNASTNDLWAAFEQASGKPVRMLMSAWTKQSGYPVVQINQTNGRYHVRQRRFFSDPKEQKRGRDKTKWPVPILYRGEGDRKSALTLLTATSAILPEKPKEWIKINHGETGFFRSHYSPELLHALRSPIAKKQLDVLDRLGIIRDAVALVENGTLRSSQVLDLIESYRNENDYAVLVEVLTALEKIGGLVFNDRTLKPRFDAFCVAFLLPLGTRLGWKTQKKDTHTTVLLRSSVLSLLGRHGHQPTIQKAQQLLRSLKKGKSLDPDIRSVVYRLCAQYGGEKEFTFFTSLHNRTPLQEERSRIATGLASFRNPRLVKRTLDFAFSKHVRSQDVYVFLVIAGRNDYAKEVAWKFVTQHWPEMLKRYGGGHNLLRMVHYVTDFETEQKAKEVERFFKTHEAPAAERAVKQAVERIRSRAAWYKRDKKDIAQWLMNYTYDKK